MVSSGFTRHLSDQRCLKSNGGPCLLELRVQTEVALTTPRGGISATLGTGTPCSVGAAAALGEGFLPPGALEATRGKREEEVAAQSLLQPRSRSLAL